MESFIFDSFSSILTFDEDILLFDEFDSKSYDCWSSSVSFWLLILLSRWRVYLLLGFLSDKKFVLLKNESTFLLLFSLNEPLVSLLEIFSSPKAEDDEDIGFILLTELTICFDIISLSTCLLEMSDSLFSISDDVWDCSVKSTFFVTNFGFIVSRSSKFFYFASLFSMLPFWVLWLRSFDKSKTIACGVT